MTGGYGPEPAGKKPDYGLRLTAGRLDSMLKQDNSIDLLRESYKKEGTLKKPDMPSQLEGMKSNSYGIPSGVGSYSPYNGTYSMLPENISRAISNNAPTVSLFDPQNPRDLVGNPAYALQLPR